MVDGLPPAPSFGGPSEQKWKNTGFRHKHDHRVFESIFEKVTDRFKPNRGTFFYTIGSTLICYAGFPDWFRVRLGPTHFCVRKSDKNDVF